MVAQSITRLTCKVTLEYLELKLSLKTVYFLYGNLFILPGALFDSITENADMLRMNSCIHFCLLLHPGALNATIPVKSMINDQTFTVCESSGDVNTEYQLLLK